MKVEVSKGKATWSLGAIITLIVSIFVAGGSAMWAFSQSMANADHKVINQTIQQELDARSKDEIILTANTFAISDTKAQEQKDVGELRVTLATINAQYAEILHILKKETP